MDKMFFNEPFRPHALLKRDKSRLALVAFERWEQPTLALPVLIDFRSNAHLLHLYGLGFFF